MIKPGPWNVSPALVDPRWRWVWSRSPLILLPMLDDPNEHHVRDYSGRGNHGSLVGTDGGPAQSKFGRSLHITGSTVMTRIEVPDAWILSGTDSLTVAAFVDIETLPPSASDVLVGQWSEIILRYTDDKYQFILDAFTVPDRAEGGVPRLGPQLVVGRFDKARNEISVWVDGVKVGSATPGGGGYNNSTNPMRFGAGNSAGSNMLGHVMAGYLWADALSDAEIIQWSADPFGPFTRARRTWSRVVATRRHLGWRRVG